MSICQSGFDFKPHEGKITIYITKNHPLLQLARLLEWDKLVGLVLPDLKASTKSKKWWLGRKLKLRIHLAVYLLQQIYNLTDRQTEYYVKDNAAFQIFAGKQIVKNWHCPDHTKIEDFRSRLTAHTQQKLANLIATFARDLGFAEPCDIDIDSTVQEANMSYPSDATLMCKLATKIKNVVDFVNTNISPFKTIKPMELNLKKIKSLARGYFFTSREDKPEVKNNMFKALYDCFKKETRLAIDNIHCLLPCQYARSPCGTLRNIKQILASTRKYISDVGDFIECGKMVPDKLLSFHLNEVKCFTNKKVGDKKYKFGRRFQLGRTIGNFVFVAKCHNAEMNDKGSVSIMLDTHNNTFGSKVDSATTDKGYYAKKNEKLLKERGVTTIGIQSPVKVKNS